MFLKRSLNWKEILDEKLEKKNWLSQTGTLVDWLQKLRRLSGGKKSKMFTKINIKHVNCQARKQFLSQNKLLLNRLQNKKVPT